MNARAPNVCIIGGAGRVGLPLGITFALVGVPTTLLDVNAEAIAAIKAGRVPFKEEGADIVVLVIGTPVDEYLNPHFAGLFKVIDGYLPHFHDGQILLLRSTVYPGTAERLQRYFADKGRKVQVAFCPERIAEGEALQELAELPQIISAFDDDARARVRALFEKVTKSDVIELA